MQGLAGSGMNVAPNAAATAMARIEANPRCRPSRIRRVDPGWPALWTKNSAR